MAKALKNTNRLFTIFFDEASVALLQGFGGWQTVLAEELNVALDWSAEYFQTTTLGAMHWKTSTGYLEESFHWFESGRFERTMGSRAPHARRRNEGFSGMTDSLGRFYANDPGAFYLDRGFSKGVNPAKRAVTIAVATALEKLGSGVAANLNKSGSKLSVQG